MVNASQPALPARRAKGSLSRGAGIVWRRQGVLWWIFLVNFLLALIGTVPVALRLAPILGPSLAAERLVKGIDPAVLIELAIQPSRPFNAVGTPTLLGLVFLVFMVFVEGGLLKLYWLDRKFTAGEFFEACGGYFWKLVRLLLLSLIAFAPLFFLAGLVVRWSGRLSQNAPEPLLGFWVEVSGLAAIFFLMSAVRLWVDMAQVRLIAENERKATRAIRVAFRLTLSNFFSLYWLYLRPSLLAWVILGGVFCFWVKFVPPQAIGVSFLLGELVLLVWLATRLWQRAGEVVWYSQTSPATPPQS